MKILIALISFVIYSFAVVSILFNLTIFASMRTTSCKGIDSIARYRSFNQSLGYIRTVGDYRKTKRVLNPQEFMNRGGDCKSIAKMVSCFCEKYNKSCRFYFDISREKLAGHVGVIYRGERVT